MAELPKESAENEKKRRAAAEAGLGPASGVLGFSITGKLFAVLLVAWIVNTSYYVLAFFCLAMLPAGLAILFDRTRGRFATKTIAACNMAGTLPYLFEIYIRYEPDPATKEIMYNTSTWVFVYGFALVGWLLVWLIPQFSILIYAAKAENRAEELKKRQEHIIEQWGEGASNSADLLRNPKN